MKLSEIQYAIHLSEELKKRHEDLADIERANGDDTVWNVTSVRLDSGRIIAVGKLYDSQVHEAINSAVKVFVQREIRRIEQELRDMGVEV